VNYLKFFKSLVIFKLNTRAMLIPFQFLTTSITKFNPTYTSDHITSRLLFNPKLTFHTLLKIFLLDKFQSLLIALIKITSNSILITGLTLVCCSTFQTIEFLTNWAKELSLIFILKDKRTIWSWTSCKFITVCLNKSV